MIKIEKLEQGIYGLITIFIAVIFIFCIFNSTKSHKTPKEEFYSLPFKEREKLAVDYLDSINLALEPIRFKKDSLNNLLKNEKDSLNRIKIENDIELIKKEAQEIFDVRFKKDFFMIEWLEMEIKKSN